MRQVTIVAGAVLLGAAVFYGVVYGLVCEFARSVE